MSVITAQELRKVLPLHVLLAITTITQLTHSTVICAQLVTPVLKLMIIPFLVQRVTTLIEVQLQHVLVAPLVITAQSKAQPRFKCLNKSALLVHSVLQL